jgi:dTDP-glucose pyrophosphorylase
MWGIIPASGKGTRIQPLAFSKELLRNYFDVGTMDGYLNAMRSVAEFTTPAAAERLT